MELRRSMHTTSTDQWCKECQSICKSLDGHAASGGGGYGVTATGTNHRSSKSSAITSKSSKFKTAKTRQGGAGDDSPRVETRSSRSTAKKSTATAASLGMKEKTKVTKKEIVSEIDEIWEFDEDGFPSMPAANKLDKNDNKRKDESDNDDDAGAGADDDNDGDNDNDSGDDGVKIEKKFLKCYDCGVLIVKEGYIFHLIEHDEERRENQLKGKRTYSGTPSRKRKASDAVEPLQIFKKTEDRKYLYLNPDDPRRNSPDAILQCPECPTFLFFSTETYEKHINRCKYVQSSRGNA